MRSSSGHSGQRSLRVRSQWQSQSQIPWPSFGSSIVVSQPHSGQVSSSSGGGGSLTRGSRACARAGRSPGWLPRWASPPLRARGRRLRCRRRRVRRPVRGSVRRVGGGAGRAGRIRGRGWCARRPNRGSIPQGCYGSRRPVGVVPMSLYRTAGDVRIRQRPIHRKGHRNGTGRCCTGGSVRRAYR